MKNLFQNYPQIQYKQDGRIFYVKDFTRRSAFFDDIKEDFSLVTEYRIEEGETPTSLAQDFYGAPELFWILLYINNIVDPLFDWPMRYPDLQNWINKEFINPDSIQYFTFNDIRYEGNTQIQELKTQLDVESTEELLSVSGVLGITVRMHQELLNDEKKNIILIFPEHISTVLYQFKRSFKNEFNNI